MIENILFALFLVILAYFIFYLVGFLKAVTQSILGLKKIIENTEIIIEKLKHEQEFIHGLMFKSENAVNNFEETVATLERMVEAGKGIKDFWTKKKGIKNKITK